MDLETGEKDAGTAESPNTVAHDRAAVRWPHLGLALSLAALLVYLCVPTRNYYWDGVFFAQLIEDARGLNPNLLLPQKLVYNVLGYVAYAGVRGVVPLSPTQGGVRALAVLQALNAVLGSLCAWVLFRVLMRTTRSRYASACLVLLFCFSATWWKFATDANCYIGSVLFLTLAFHALGAEPLPSSFRVGVCHGFAMLLHQWAVLFLPVAVLGLVIQNFRASRRRRAGAVLVYVLVAVTMTLPSYYAAFFLQHGTGELKGFLNWLTSYAPDATVSLDLRKNLDATALGYLRLFIGGRVSLMVQFMGPLSAAVLLLFSAAVAVLAYRTIRFRADIRSFLRPARGDRPLRVVGALAAVWLASYAGFLFFCGPNKTFYKLFCFPAIIVLLSCFFARRQQAMTSPRRYRAALLVCAIALANFALSIFPYSHSEASPPLQFALGLNDAWTDRTVVYYPSFSSDDAFARYFNPKTTWRWLNMDNLAAFPAEVARESRLGREVWLNTTAINALTEKKALPQAWIQDRRELVNQNHRIRYFRVGPL